MIFENQISKWISKSNTGIVNQQLFYQFNFWFLTFSTFLTLLIAKVIVDFYKKGLRKEAFLVGWEVHLCM